MNNTKRTLVAIAGFTVLAASSHATLSFSGLSSYETASGDEVTVNQTNWQSSTLKGVTTPSPFLFSDTFTVSDTAVITSADVSGVLAHVFKGTLSLDVSIATVASPIYSSSATSTTGPKNLASGETESLSLTGSYLVTISGSYTGTTGASFGSVPQFTVEFQDSPKPPPVPEPASFAAVGCGLVGLAARRRKGVN